MAKNPLAVSTGQGKGEAQVFGSTYNPYFKDKKAQAEKNLGTAQSLADIEMGEAWDRDIPVINQDIQEVRKYVQENARRIMEGDNTAIMEAKKLQQKAFNSINHSKTAYKTWWDLKQKINDNPDDYTDETKAEVDSYALRPGDWDYTKQRLDPKFKYEKWIDEQADVIRKMDVKDGKYKISPSGLSGKFSNFDVLTKYSATPEEAVRDYVDNVWSQEGVLADQMREKYNNDKEAMFQDFNRFRETKIDQRTPKESGGGSGYGKDSTTLPELIVDEEEIGMETPFNYDGTAYAIGGNTKRYKGFSASGKRGRVINFDSKDVLYVNPISKDALANPEDTETFLETNQWSKIQEKIQKEGAVSGRIEGVYYYPIFKSGAKGARTGTDLSNQLVPKEILDNNGKVDLGEGKEKDYSDLIEFKPMIAIKKSGQTGATVLKPYENNEHLVKDAIEDGNALVSDYEEFMKKEKQGNKTYTFDEWFNTSEKEKEEVVEEQTETTETKEQPKKEEPKEGEQKDKKGVSAESVRKISKKWFEDNKDTNLTEEEVNQFILERLQDGMPEFKIFMLLNQK